MVELFFLSLHFRKEKEDSPPPLRAYKACVFCAMQQWSERTGLTVAQIASRLRSDWTVERALTQPMGKRNRTWGATGAAGVAGEPGVVSDFRKIEGTGAGRSAQDSPKLSFSMENAECR